LIRRHGNRIRVVGIANLAAAVEQRSQTIAGSASVANELLSGQVHHMTAIAIGQGVTKLRHIIGLTKRSISGKRKAVLTGCTKGLIIGAKTAHQTLRNGTLSERQDTTNPIV
jgi:hypothetical protein